MNIWKLLLANALNFGVFVGLPYFVRWIGVQLQLSTFLTIGPLVQSAWIIMATTALGLMFKTIASDLISGRFTFNKQGYDFCILTMGASLSSFAMQLTSNIDLFPGIGTLTGFSPSTTADVLTQRRVILFLVFLVSTAMSFLTAYISRLIRESEETDDQLKKVKAPQALSLLNYLLGMGLFGAYLLILITKG